MTDKDNKKKSPSAKATEDTAKKPAGSKAVEKLVDEISKLSVLELSELVNALQDKLGVSAAPIAAAPTAGAVPTEGVQAGKGDEESGGGTLVMTASGDNKIAVIKALREINQNLTLMDAKKMTEELPAEIIKDGKAEEVKSASEKLKSAGATIEIK